jgi:anti-anti-sigma regulatory factor
VAAEEAVTESDTRDSELIVAVRGEVDLATAAEFEAELDRALQKAPDRLIIDPWG